MSATAARWPRRMLGEVAQIQGGIQKQSKRAPRENHYPFLRVANVTSKGLDLSEIHRIELFGDELNRVRLQRGDLLVVEGNGSPSQIGRAAIWNGAIDDCVHQNHLIRVRAGSVVLPEYLHLYWNSPANRDFLTAISSSTSGLHTLSARKLQQVEVPIPPLEEQQRIIAILDDHLSRLDAAGDYLRGTQRRLIALERAILDALFGCDPTIPLSDLIVDIEAGKSFGTSNTPAKDDEWGIVKVSAMTRGVFRPEENKAVSAERVDPRFEIHEGDLLVSRANTADYVGASALVGPVRPRLLLSDKSMRIRPRPGIQPEWLWRALQAPSARSQISALATGTKDSMRNISQASLRRVLLPAADDFQRSQALAQYDLVAEQIARLRADVATGTERHDRLRRSLLTAAFSGELTSGYESEEGVA